MSDITYLAVARIYDRHNDDFIEKIEYEADTRKEANEWLQHKERSLYNDKDYRCEGSIYSVVECCGEKMCCVDFTNTCYRCGADYNMNGIRLAPRRFWGEETGEHWTDCY